LQIEEEEEMHDETGKGDGVTSSAPQQHAILLNLIITEQNSSNFSISVQKRERLKNEQFSIFPDIRTRGPLNSSNVSEEHVAFVFRAEE
jgi:hypothetical protein